MHGAICQADGLPCVAILYRLGHPIRQPARVVLVHPTHWLMCTQVANYCLCQRCWPFGHAKSPFKTKEDYMDALLAHHAVMTAAMKAKQAVEPSASAALKHAVEDAVKMYVPL